MTSREKKLNQLNIDSSHNLSPLYPEPIKIIDGNSNNDNDGELTSDQEEELRLWDESQDLKGNNSVAPLIEADFPLFSDFPKYIGQYLFKAEKPKRNSSKQPQPPIRAAIAKYPTNIAIGLNIDTEYVARVEETDIWKQTARKPLTTQIKGIHADAIPMIFGRTLEINEGRDYDHIDMIASDFDPVDYMRRAGLTVETRTATSSQIKDLPKFLVILYAHFATAEINLIAGGTIGEEIKHLQRSTGDRQIFFQRGLHCQWLINDDKLDYVTLQHIISINGYDYELCLKIVDTCALHGVASYKNLCEAVGLDTPYKDLISKKEKEDILKVANERWSDFKDYALGDLQPYNILMCFDERWSELYSLLGLSNYYRQPKLSIGGSVKALFEAALAKKLNIIDNPLTPWVKGLTESVVHSFIQPSSASELRQHSKETRCLLSKVEGGRCRNNRPTDIFIQRKIKGKYDTVLICDLDISGCYGEGQRNQSYPIGTPEIFDYKVLKNNEYTTLREWLNSYDVNIKEIIKAFKTNDYNSWNNPENWGELISGLWQARISTKTILKYPQDYFASWFLKGGYGVNLLAKSLQAMKCDTELLDFDWVDFDEDTGFSKVFNHEIKNGVITHDGLEWIFAIASDRQREELLDNIQILSSAVYPRSQRITRKEAPESYTELVEKNNSWKGVNTTRRIKKADGNTQIVMTFEGCHAWFDINIGELIVDDLLIERKRAQKKHGKKSPLDVLFKLCVNTLYGDMVSKFFVTSNPVVGNNITARARAMAFYMEKGLYGFQPITDGCGFLLNAVLSGGRDSINGTSVNLHRSDSQLAHWHIKQLPLGGVEILAEVKTFNYKKYVGDINLDTKKEIEKSKFFRNWVSEKIVEVNEEHFTYIVGEQIYEPVLEIDVKHDGCFTVTPASVTWIEKMSMEHLQEQFKMVSVLHKITTGLIIKKDLSVEYITRKGEFSFEVKDVYHSGAFHGSANYIFENLEKTYVKARGYETDKQHWGIENKGENLINSEKYEDENNPMKDFMHQLLKNPEGITRQIPGVKQGILKVGDYKNNSEKYDTQGLQPGDTVMKPVLLQEFSLSQFTFQTFEQYMLWCGMVEKLKQDDYQSFEGFFLNPDGTLNFIEMTNWVEKQIAVGVTDPFGLLTDKNDNRKRTEARANAAIAGKTKKGKKPQIITLSHPAKDSVNSLKDSLKEECD